MTESEPFKMVTRPVACRSILQAWPKPGEGDVHDDDACKSLVETLVQMPKLQDLALSGAVCGRHIGEFRIGLPPQLTRLEFVTTCESWIPACVAVLGVSGLNGLADPETVGFPMEACSIGKMGRPETTEKHMRSCTRQHSTTHSIHVR